MNSNRIASDRKLKNNNAIRIFHTSSAKILHNNKYKNEIPLTTNIFKNHELQKSLSIHINNLNNNKNLSNSNFSGNYNNIIDNKKSFLTMIPINSNQGNNFLPLLKGFFSYSKYKAPNNSFYLKRRNNKKSFEMKNFNDEKCFSTSKNQKRFLFPKNYYIIKQYRINHDTNIFNLKHVITDYTKDYERNSYKIKKVVQDDMFVNKIKNDLLKLKFNNRIKPYDDL